MRYMTGNFSCQEIAELVTDYLDDSLTFSEQLRFQMHVGMCVACRSYLSQIKYTVKTLGQLPSEPIPDHVKEELLRRFQSWKKDQASASHQSEPS